MILDTLHHAGRYESLHPLFAPGFAWLERFHDEIADGRHAIEGESLFALVQRYETASPASKKFEAHRRYIDIQYLLSGEEVIGCVPLELLSADEAFDVDRDIGFFREPVSWTAAVLRPGEFAVLWPNDAHKPGCALHGPAPVRKVVLKIAV